MKEYREALKSSVADMKNVAGPYGGAITAALILQNSWTTFPGRIWTLPVRPLRKLIPPSRAKGGTGFGVRTLVRFLLTL